MKLFPWLAVITAVVGCCAGAANNPAADSHPKTGLTPPPLPPPQPLTGPQVATRRLGFGAESTLQKIANWFFPNNNDHKPPPGRAISRNPFQQQHGPLRQYQSGRPQYGPPPSRPNFPHPPPQQVKGLKCNPCNRAPWVPLPHGQYLDGGNNFAVVNAPQLHQSSHGGSQPNTPIYHHSPLPQGYLPTFNNHPESQYLASVDQVNVAGGTGSGPEIIPSINVANYVSSVEYPINVEQSPIIDVQGNIGDITGPGYSSAQSNIQANQYEATSNHQQEVNHEGQGVAQPTAPAPFIINADAGVQQQAASVAVASPASGGDVAGKHHDEQPSSFQNVNIDTNDNSNNNNNNQQQQELTQLNHGSSGSEFTITPSVQTSAEHSHNQQSHHNQIVQGTVLPPIPTQQQPPSAEAPGIFTIPTFQQPPSIHPPQPFHNVPTAAAFPVSGQQQHKFIPPSGQQVFSAPSGQQSFVPPSGQPSFAPPSVQQGFIPPSAHGYRILHQQQGHQQQGGHQQHQFFNAPSIPTFQQPPRGFTSPGQLNILRQAPSAPGLAPPPPPQSAPSASGVGSNHPSHPYRFEFSPPSGNALQNLNQHILATPPPTLDFTPWVPTGSANAGGLPTNIPPSASAAAAIAPLTQSGVAGGSATHAGNVILNNKRPKKIQIIVPYTIVSQVNQLDPAASGNRAQWHNREINHQIQESRTVTSINIPSPSPPSATQQVTSGVHILASNIRDLLRDEQHKQQQLLQQQQQQVPPNAHLLSLQHNIDQWTAQEFSNAEYQNVVNTEEKLKGTTAAGTLAPSKIIPQEYFSTSPVFSTSSTTSLPFFDHEPAGSINRAIQTKVTSNRVSSVRNKPAKVAPPPSTPAAIVEEVTTTTEVPSTTVAETTTTEESRRTTWDQLQLAYSQSTNEKVYVVTPMSTHQWADLTTPKYNSDDLVSTTERTTSKGFYIRGRAATKQQASPSFTTTSTAASTVDLSGFRSPRFTVRPTPAPRVSESGRAASSPPSRGNRYYTVPTPTPYHSVSSSTARPVTLSVKTTPSSTGSSSGLDLTTIPTYMPPPGENVQTSGGHSKVVTVVTSSTSNSSPHKKPTRLTHKTSGTKTETSRLQQRLPDIVAATAKLREEELAAVREAAALDIVKYRPS